MRHEDSNGTDYLGAMLGDERRLVLVPLDPDRPWTAFRRMRAWMKRGPNPKPEVELFRAAQRTGTGEAGDAEVIPIRSRDGGR